MDITTEVAGGLKMDEYEKNLCACCGQSKVGLYEFCKVCGWQNDDLQNQYPDYGDGFGPNKMRLNEAKIAFCEGKEVY